MVEAVRVKKVWADDIAVAFDAAGRAFCANEGNAGLTI